MKSLASAIKHSGATGEPIPDVFPAFVENEVKIRRGQLTLIASGPGGAKSVLAQTIIANTALPALVIAPDSDAYTSYTRMASMLSGDLLIDVERAINQGSNQYDHLLDAQEHVRWVFDEDPSIDDIRENLIAFAHLYGEWPGLLIVDNLRNVFAEIDDDNQKFKRTLAAIKALGAESGAAAIVLHHLVGEYESGDKRPPLSAVEGKVSKEASLILTLYRSKHGDVGCCIVKNRFGPADPSGQMVCYLNTRLDRMKVA